MAKTIAGIMLFVIAFGSCKVRNITYTYAAVIDGKQQRYSFRIPKEYEISPFFSDQSTNSKLFLFPDSSYLYISQGKLADSPNYALVEDAINSGNFLIRDDTVFIFQSYTNNRAWKEIRIRDDIWFGYCNIPANSIVKFDKAIYRALPKMKKKAGKKPGQDRD